MRIYRISSIDNIQLYHGTSLIAADKAKKGGFLLPGIELGISTDTDPSKVYLTPSWNYAYSYANYASVKNNSDPVILEFNIPISEVIITGKEETGKPNEYIYSGKLPMKYLVKEHAITQLKKNNNNFIKQ